MFRTYPVTVVRVAAIAFVLYYVLNLSSEAIKVSRALEQSKYLLRDLIRYFLLLFAGLGFWQLYRHSLARLGTWVLVATMLTAIFGIAAYLCLSLNLFLVPETSWQTSLLAFFEFLKGEFSMQFQSFVGGRQSLAAWISKWITQIQLQFLPLASDFPTGRGWIKLYLLFKLIASLLLKFSVVFGCLMFLFPRPLPKQNLLIALLMMLWLLSPIYGGVLSGLSSWVLNTKAMNGEAVKNLVAFIVVCMIALRMWIDASTLKSTVRKRVRKKTPKKVVKKTQATKKVKTTKKVVPPAKKVAPPAKKVVKPAKKTVKSKKTVSKK